MNWRALFGVRARVSTDLHAETLGQGERVLVFIPGLGGTTRYWASRLGPLEAHYRIVLVDLLGFGNSPKPWVRYSVENHVDALHEKLADLGSISLIGHSLGALITVAYAARYPANVRNIALIGMPCFGTQDRAYRYLREGPVKGGYIFTNIVLTMAACVLTRRVFGRLLPYLIRSVPREVAEDLVKHTWRSSTSSLWEVVYRYDARNDIARLPAGTGVLFIHGDKDLMAPLALARRLAKSRPGWKLKVLPGVDHHPFLRDPASCLALIDDLSSSDGEHSATYRNLHRGGMA